jgi:hypothetical protein
MPYIRVESDRRMLVQDEAIALGNKKHLIQKLQGFKEVEKHRDHLSMWGELLASVR